jgi:peroxiredoxin Q/BCP
MALLVAALVAFAAGAHAQAPGPAPAPAGGVELKVGDMAPNFTLPGSDGKTYKLSDLRGKAVVLAWFPKAFTGG